VLRSALLAPAVLVLIGGVALSACAPSAPTQAAAQADFSGIWATKAQTVDDGIAAGYPIQLRNTPWAPLSAGPPEQMKGADFETVKAEVSKVIAADQDVFAWARSKAFKPPLTEAGMAAQKAAADERAKAPRVDYAQCLSRNTIGIGNTVQIFQTAKRVVIVPETGFNRSIYLDGEKGRENSASSYVGYSAARWEGKSLVVTTTNFNDGPVNGWPASADAKVEETYSLSPDGNLLTVKIVYSDPQYLKEPVARMMFLDRAPEDKLLIQDNCVDALAGAAEFARTLGHNYDKGVLP
jgi:hypothetical protein